MATTKKINMTGDFIAVSGPGGLVTFTAPSGPLRWVIAASATPSTLTVGHVLHPGANQSLELAAGEYLQLSGGADLPVAVTAENEV